MTDLSKLTPFQNTVLASIGSTIEVFLQHPLNIIKNSIQYEKPVVLNRLLYKGIFLNAGSMSLITAIQFSSFASYNKILNNSLASSLLAGATSALVTSPFEMMIIQRCIHNNLTTTQMIKHNLQRIS